MAIEQQLLKSLLVPFLLKIGKILAQLNNYNRTMKNWNNWNSLPEAVVTAKTVNEFKSKLNDTWKYHPLKFDV